MTNPKAPEQPKPESLHSALGISQERAEMLEQAVKDAIHNLSPETQTVSAVIHILLKIPDLSQIELAYIIWMASHAVTEFEMSAQLMHAVMGGLVETVDKHPRNKQVKKPNDTIN